MSEYWKSTPKYWCKHCSAYVKDTSFERKQHEITGKHQGNLKRFLRDIQNNHERDLRDKDRAKSEVERLKGVAAGETGPISAPHISKPTKPATGPQSAADLKRQWAQLAELGIQVPQAMRSEVAMAGDWQITPKQVVDHTSLEPSLSIGVKKRKYEGQEEDQEEKEIAGDTVARRGWGAATKSYPGQDQVELDDLLAGSISVKKENPVKLKSQHKLEDPKSSLQQENSGFILDDSATSKRPSNELQDTTSTDPSLIKQESQLDCVPQSLDKVLPDLPVPMFKKRKPKSTLKS